MKVRLGEWNAKDDDEPYKNIEIEVENIDIHPDFNPDNLFNDVALIRLSKPIDVNAFPHIRSACLPKQQNYNNAGQRLVFMQNALFWFVLIVVVTLQMLGGRFW